MSHVEGEASESEEEIYTGSSLPSTINTKESSLRVPLLTPTAEVVEGEATESEDEDAAEEQHSTIIDNIQPAVKSTRRPEYDTPLHRKLREKNIYLHRAVHQLVTKSYKTSNQGLAVCAEHLSKLQGIGQETLDILGETNEDLDKLKETMDTVTSRNILPVFKKPLPRTTSQTEPTTETIGH
ncbi:uncharacterized protein LOC134186972 [Corticium candelabrum]|uniref:uncharacterized protein LOC134186972 n=1 Tax=Corticium candelabrum TaxID=121492 RepID=UPI002E269FD1|nr:uncharacterized protein LOC134186972 [Corticium candelabrum]